MSGQSLEEAIVAVGFALPETIIWDGKVHRFATDPDRRHARDGWYVAHDDASGRAAAFGSWRDSSKHTWSNGTGRQLTAPEWAEIERAKAAKLAEARRDADLAAARAERFYEQASPEVSFSAYLDRKGITCPAGVRALQMVSTRALGFSWDGQFSGVVVPVRNAAGAIRSLQLIPEDAGQKKLFLKDGQTEGCFHVLGELAGATRILLAEGLATAQSAVQATGLPAVVAFSAGNLPKVYAALRARHAAAQFIVLSDDDPAGRKAAAACPGARAVLPTDDASCNDFNDLHLARGPAAVRAAILGQPAPVSTPAPVAEAPAVASVTIEDDSDESWRAGLIVKHKSDGTQHIPCRVHNLILILRHAAEFRGRVRFNEFSSQISIDGRDLDDVGPVKIKAQIERLWVENEKVPTSDVLEALSVVASEQKFHPVREYLDGLAWDGVGRITHFFEDFCGSPRDDYHMAAANSLFVSAVARIYRPGCKVDTMVIKHSPQGFGKSKAWLALFGDWCQEITASLADKDFYSNLRGVWCADFSELDAFSRAETTQIKRIVTSQSDTYRPHYGRTRVTFPRQCIFVGGTNRSEWSADETGARRFLPVQVYQRINIDALLAARDQLWAEAVARFHAGAIWWDIPDAQTHQEQIYVGDCWEDQVSEFLRDAYFQHIASGKPSAQFSVSTGDILSGALKIEVGRHGTAEQTRVGKIMRRIGWERRQPRGQDGKRQRAYFPNAEWIQEVESERARRRR